MQLSSADRLQLSLLYRVLECLEPNQAWRRQRRIVEGGYESEYEGLTASIKPLLSSDDSELVKKIMDMFEAIQDSLETRGEDAPGASSLLLFQGFSEQAELEAKLAGFSDFLFENGRWASLRPTSPIPRYPMLERYGRMLKVFAPLHQPGRDYRAQPLSTEQLQLIARAAAEET